MLYRNISKILYATGFVGTFIAIIFILFSISNKTISKDKIVSSIAVASLTIYILCSYNKSFYNLSIDFSH